MAPPPPKKPGSASGGTPPAIQAQFQRALALHRAGDLDAAAKAYEGLLRIMPRHVDSMGNLGSIYRRRGRNADAIAIYRKALEVDPNHTTVLNNFANALNDQNNFAEAVKLLKRAVDIDPNSAAAQDTYGFTLYRLDQFDEAERALLTAVRLAPNNANAWNNLGAVYKRQCRMAEAMACYKKSAQLDPNQRFAGSNYIFDLQFLSEPSAAEIAQAHRDWGEARANPITRQSPKPPRRPLDGRKLRVGFVSPDFHRHPVSYFFLPLVRARPKDQWEMWLYPTRPTVDDMTQELKAGADAWRELYDTDDDRAAAQIRADALDILFDLSGHTGGHRLLLFARRPAPVQATWIGYFNTTGMEAMDYLLADPVCIPDGSEHLYVERVLRLPHGFLCYLPPDDAPPVAPPPFERNGFVTFGSTNQLAKVTDEVVQIWARLLNQVPGSRLLLRARALNDDSTRDRFARKFAEAGLDRSRLMLQRGGSQQQILETYGEIDIALDPFPCVGGTTTCEALWMGVPVVTFTGERFGSRHSASHLRNIGMHTLVAPDIDGYMKIARDLAADAPRRAELRRTLRDRVLNSPLCDGPRFAADFTRLLFQMWAETEPN